jgi:hypothetical protein
MLNVKWPFAIIEHSTFHIRHSSEIESPGAVAQLGEHLLCKQGVVGSIPISSTMERDGQAILAAQRFPRISAVNSKVGSF